MIGIGAADAEIAWDGWRADAAFLPRSYVDAVAASGGLPVLLPALEREPGPLALARLDGLLLAGGPDIDPEHYGARPSPFTEATSPRRDRAELALVRAAIAGDVPMLAVCRGFEVLNVALGGTLEQHLPDRVGHDGHLTVPNQFGEHEIEVVIECPGLPAGRQRVRSYHHQGVARLANGLQACAFSADGVIEAARYEDATWAIGVQWHPEAGQDRSLFKALVDAARTPARGLDPLGAAV